MSLYASIGYVLGIIIFAIILRMFRKQMIESHILKAKNKNSAKTGNHD